MFDPSFRSGGSDQRTTIGYGRQHKRRNGQVRHLVAFLWPVARDLSRPTESSVPLNSMEGTP
jgi:hypothetical protein